MFHIDETLWRPYWWLWRKMYERPWTFSSLQLSCPDVLFSCRPWRSETAADSLSLALPLATPVWPSGLPGLSRLRTRSSPWRLVSTRDSVHMLLWLRGWERMARSSSSSALETCTNGHQRSACLNPARNLEPRDKRQEIPIGHMCLNQYHFRSFLEMSE